MWLRTAEHSLVFAAGWIANAKALPPYDNYLDGRTEARAAGEDVPTRNPYTGQA